MRRREFLKMATVCGGAAAWPAEIFFAERSAWAADDVVEGEPIVFNQAGYLPDAAKLFTLRLSSPSSPSSSSVTFSVRPVNGGAVVLTGKPSAVREDAASGDRVQVCDLSSVRAAGHYVLETDADGAGTKKSAPFEIGKDVYRRALWLRCARITGSDAGAASILEMDTRIRRVIWTRHFMHRRARVVHTRIMADGTTRETTGGM